MPKMTTRRTRTTRPTGAARALASLLTAVAVLAGCSRTAVAQDGEELIRELSAADAADRAYAACELERMGTTAVRRAMPRLLELLSDDTPVEGRLCRDGAGWRQGWHEESSPGREAALALEEAGVEALDPLIEILSDGVPVARENAALALGLIEESRAVPALEARLRTDRTVRVRERAAWALGMIESSEGVETLARATGDESTQVREQAAWALGMIESARGVEPLISLLRDEDAGVRKQAAWALGMIEDARAVGPLSEALEDDDRDVREQAMWALGMVVRDADPDSIDTSELARRLRRSLDGE